MVELIAAVSPWHWFALAGVILIAELLTGTTYLLWPAAAAVLVGFVHLSPIDVGWVAEVVLFAGLSAILALFGDRFVRPAWFRTDRPRLNDPSARLIGSTVVAVTPFTTGSGRVRVGDSEWAAALVPDHGPVDAGATLTVVAVEGVTLRVEPRVE